MLLPLSDAEGGRSGVFSSARIRCGGCMSLASCSGLTLARCVG